jgi:hypothetical protein
VFGGSGHFRALGVIIGPNDMPLREVARTLNE